MRWIIENWHDLSPTPAIFAALAMAAVLAGAMVGIERERKGKPVGIRTLSLVSLGSATFTMVSYAFGMPGTGGEALRIAPQVVSGIGFLGAGVIIRGQFGITGLTSAATIWAVAAAGMVIGTGYGGAGLCLSAFILGLLWLLTAIEHRYVGPCRYQWVNVSYRPAGGKALIRIEEVLDEYRVSSASRLHLATLPGAPDACEHVRITYCCMHRHHREFLMRLADLPDVEAIAREEDERPEITLAGGPVDE